MAAPARLSGLSGRDGPGLDPCAALQRDDHAGPGAKRRGDIPDLGQSRHAEEARALIHATRARDLTAMLDEVKACWADLLGTVQVRTPGPRAWISC